MQGHEDESYPVSPLELFFDLIFAFAFTKLSMYLATELSWRHALETLVLLVTTVTAWSFTSWIATHVHVDDNRSAAWMMVVVALFGLFMNAMIPRAFTDSPWAFALPMLAIQLGRTLWCIVSMTDRLYRAHYARMMVWLMVTTPLWLIGASSTPETRLAWWGSATAIELIGTWLAHPIPGHWLRSEKLEFDGEHMLERCRLFLMIALGEAVLSTGAAISNAGMSITTALVGTAALTGNIALFSLLFGAANRRIAAHIHMTHNPVRLTRHAMNTVMFVAAGLVAVAVANELIIHDPHHTHEPGITMLLFGGPALIVASIGLYQRAILKVSRHFEWMATAALVASGVISAYVPPGWQLSVSTLLLILIAWGENTWDRKSKMIGTT